MSKPEIILAKTAGFCFGVERAVDMVNKLLDDGEKPATLGPIIHNPQMVKILEDRGARTLDDETQVRAGETIVIRSHGVPQDLTERIKTEGKAFCDATCPFVKKIQNIVKKESAEEGTAVLITGDKAHPEVISIASYCKGSFFIAGDVDEFKSAVVEIEKGGFSRAILVSQTTFNTEKFEECREIALLSTINFLIFDTICKATEIRQKEAVQLASKCDIMLVVGGRASSNTNKLAEMCSKRTKTFLIETADELSEIDFSHAKRIGITAGASTPACIIKEVQVTMSENENKIENDDISFLEGLEQTLKTVNNGDRVMGHVTAVGQTEVQVEIGTKHAGYIPLAELTSEPDKTPADIVKKGDEIELVVVRVNDVEGTVMLSKRRLDAVKGYDTVCAAFESGEILEGVVTDVVRGGVIALTNSTRVFIPASQATASRTDSLEDLLKQKVNFKIIEVNKNRRRAVGSIRAVLKEERKELEEKFWQDAEIGKEYTGMVKSITAYGAFVDLGGVDGMVHISELSWGRIKHPTDIVKVGETVSVFIKELDKEKNRISLGYKRNEDNPWDILRNKYPLGSVLKAKIVSLTPFGAFANILPGIDGLIHISQISTEHIEKPADVLAIGQEVELMLIDVDFDKKRISLSIRAIAEEGRRTRDAKDAITRKTPVEEAEEVNVVYEAGPEVSGGAFAALGGLADLKETVEVVTTEVEKPEVKEETLATDAPTEEIKEETLATDAPIEAEA